MKTSVYIATSLDGFIARKDGSLDWLHEAKANVPDGEDFGFRAFMDSVNALIMGRKTFEQVLSFGQWAYGETPVIVLSANPRCIPPDAPDTVTRSSERPCTLLERLSREGVAHVYIDGGATIRSFLSADLVDEITVTVIPVLLGEGISPFGPLDKDIGLIHQCTHVFEFGFVQTTYLVRRPTLGA